MAAIVLEPGVYFIQCMATGTVMDLIDGSSTDDTKIQSYHKRELNDSKVPAQLWVITFSDETANPKLYHIMNAASSTYMRLGTATDQLTCKSTHSDKNSQWSINRTEDTKAYVIENAQFTSYNAGLEKDDSTDGIKVNGTSGTTATTDNKMIWIITRA